MSFSSAFAGLGFVANLIGSPSAQRAILVPASDSSGNAVTNSQGQQVFQALDGYVTLEESHYDDMSITEHPVEQGSVISDHAFAQPARLRLRLGWSAAMSLAGEISIFGVAIPTLAGVFGLAFNGGQQFLQSVYAQMLVVQKSRELVTIYTGKRPYANMLLKTLETVTTQQTENSLILEMEFQELILTSTSVVQVPQGMNTSNMATPTDVPPASAGTQNLLPGAAYNSSAGASVG